jgi:hypothetical protein
MRTLSRGASPHLRHSTSVRTGEQRMGSESESIFDGLIGFVDLLLVALTIGDAAVVDAIDILLSKTQKRRKKKKKKTLFIHQRQ